MKGQFEAIKYAYRQSKDGVIVSFVVHPNDLDAAFAIAPIGTVLSITYSDEVEDTSGPLAAGVPRATADAPIPPEQTPKAPDKQRMPGAASSQDRVVQRCAILCDDRQFQRWLWLREGRSKERFDAQSMELAAQDAAATVRAICGIASRRDLAIDNAARRRWDALLLAYEQAVGLAPVDHRRSA